MMNLIIAITATNVIMFTIGFAVVYKIAKKIDRNSCE